MSNQNYLEGYSPIWKVLVIVVLFRSLTVHAETISLPLTQTNGWHFLTYKNIRPNIFNTSTNGFKIGITNSASPTLFPLKNAQVTELRVTGKISGSLNMPTGKQGEKGFDDYTVRIGLVESGTRTLSWREQTFGPNWIKQLFALAPPGGGISKIHFFNVGTEARQLGKTRTHPASKLLEETVVAVPEADGHFTFMTRLDQPMDVVAVWISCDGDDTKSSFAVVLNKVELVMKDSTEKRGSNSK